MSKSRLDSLRGKCPVFYRSTRDLSGGQANIWYSDADASSIVLVSMVTDDPSTKPMQLHAHEITYVKTKEYADKSNSQLWVLALGMQHHHQPIATAEDVEQALILAAQGSADLVQHIFQFKDREVRDIWDHCLRTLAVNPEAVKEAEVKVVASKFRPVASLALQPPPAGIVVSIRIMLEEVPVMLEPVILEISEADTGSDACKRLTNQFIDDHRVLPTENTSLYRYIRSVVQRALMEKETKIIIDEINRLKFETLLTSEKYHDLDKTNHTTIEKIVTEGTDNLKRIADSIPVRIGQHGSGATVVNMILKRNVEKLKLINDLSAKKYLKEHVGGASPQALA